MALLKATSSSTASTQLKRYLRPTVGWSVVAVPVTDGVLPDDVPLDDVAADDVDAGSRSRNRPRAAGSWHHATRPRVPQRG